MSTQLVATLLPARVEEAAHALLHPPAGADHVELRLDALDAPTAATVERLLALPRSIPVLATCRTRPGLDAATQRALLAAAAAAGAETVDVEDTLLDAVTLPDGCAVLPSCHLSRFVPRLPALATRLLSHGTAHAKLVVPAETPRQLAQLVELQAEFAGRLAVVPIGRLAEAGRVFTAASGAPFSFGAADAQRRGHADQPTVERLHEVFGIGHVGPATRFFAVVGSPVAHSLSPAFHNTVFRGVGRDARLVPLDVERLGDVLDVAAALRLDGLAVTHPFKSVALDLAASRLPGAQATGAANTLLRTPAGWQARNTDWKAACDLLPRLLRSWRKRHAGQVPRVLLLGSGGAARAIAVALADEEVELSIWSRRLSNARGLAEALAGALAAVAVPDPLHAPGDLVVNATPVGLPGVDAGELQLSATIFRPGALAVDLAYGGTASPFREAARAADAHLTPGEDFFCSQARRQAELFTATSPSAEVLARAARRCGAAP